MLETSETDSTRTLRSTATLIVVDVQNAFLDPKWGERNNPQAEGNIVALVAAWRRTRRPVIYIRHVSRSSDSIFALGAPGSRLQAEIVPIEGEAVIDKHENSAFIGTTLERDLCGADARQVIIVGLTTDHCVSTTARMAANLGFETFLVADATATFERIGPGGDRYSAQQMHDVNLASLHGEFATIVNTAELSTMLGAAVRIET